MRDDSLDTLEIREYLKPGPSPMAGEPVEAALTDTPFPTADFVPRTRALSGVWRMTLPEGDVIPAKVPGSIHTALLENGRLLDDEGKPVEDPYFGLQDRFAREASFRPYSLETDFTLSAAELERPLWLRFHGVCETADFELNGIPLGSHTGMFGGPDFDISSVARVGENRLTVRLHPAPNRKRREGEMPTFFGGGNPWLNLGWLDTAIFNCTYGWHYADIPPLGIWQPVELESKNAVEVRDPFLATRTVGGEMDFFTELWADSPCRGELRLKITPETFEGAPLYLSYPTALEAGENPVRLRFAIPQPRLWWLNGLGEQPLYRAEVSFLPAGAAALADSKAFSFGIRTLEMLPIADGQGERRAEPGRYNWTFVLNGRPVFIKGTGWCTMDALMRFTRENYEKYLSVARLQHVQMLRAWGGGLVETDEFYDFCDRCGIAVFQEWPTAWDSYVYQPREVLLETVRRGVLRLRNRASLFLWCGGNEGAAPLETQGVYDPAALNAMGKLTLELDGTRPWHRQEPCGGSLHNYLASWEGKNPAANMTLEAPFFGEFGVDCWPNLESIRKFLPEKEEDAYRKGPFSIRHDSVLAHHTPMFDLAGDVGRQQQHVHLFCPPDSLEHAVVGSQLAQAVGLRYTLERARTRWPQCTGAIMYKLNDPYPAASWSTVDWYGAPKMAAYYVARSFAPLTAVVRLDKADIYGEEVALPVFLLDDALRGREAALSCVVRAYDGQGRRIKEEVYRPRKGTEPVCRVGTFTLTAQETAAVPLFIVADCLEDGERVARNDYFLNYEREQGCLFTLPRTQLTLERGDGALVAANRGETPAFGVHFDCEEVSDRFRPADNYFWLEPGESVRIPVNFTDGIKTIVSF